MCGANAIHVATALKPKCQEFIATDARLSREKFKTSTAERVASLKTLIDQRKSESEIAEALSMVKKQVKMGIRILQRRS